MSNPTQPTTANQSGSTTSPDPNVEGIKEILSHVTQPENILQHIYDEFAPLATDIVTYSTNYEKVVVIDPEDEEGIALAKEAARALAKIRKAVGKVKSELKRDALDYGKAVQSVHNFLQAQIEPVEKHYKEQATIVQRLEEEAKQRLALDRMNQLKPFAGYYPHNLDLKEMPEDQFEMILIAAEAKQQKAQEQERLAEEEFAAQEEKRKEADAARAEREAQARAAEILRQKAIADAAEAQKAADAEKAREMALLEKGDVGTMQLVLEQLEGLSYPTGMKSDAGATALVKVMANIREAVNTCETFIQNNSKEVK